MAKFRQQQINIAHSELQDRRRREETCDVFLVCKDGRLPAHRIILRAGSKYMDAMFSNLKEAPPEEISLPTISKNTMNIILGFVYHENIDITSLTAEQILPLLSSSHLLEIQPLLEFCAEELKRKVNSENWAVVLREAQKCDIKSLVGAVINYVDKSNLKNSQEFLQLEFECFILFINHLSEKTCPSADRLVKLICDWVTQNVPERKEYLTTLLSPIDFVSLSKNVIADLINHYDLFLGNHELSDFLLKKVAVIFSQPAPPTVTTNYNKRICTVDSRSVAQSNSVQTNNVSTVFTAQIIDCELKRINDREAVLNQLYTTEQNRGKPRYLLVPSPTQQNRIQSMYLTNTSQQNLGPPAGPPMGPPVVPLVSPLVGPLVGPPVGPPVGPLVGPPVGPLVGPPVGQPMGQPGTIQQMFGRPVRRDSTHQGQH